MADKVARYCTTCGRITTQRNDSLFVCEIGHDNWLNPACGVSVYIIKEGKVLFGVRSSHPGKGMLDVPGGFIEINESAEQAAIRETKEEFGIDVTLRSCFGTYSSTYLGRPALNIVFLATMSDQPITALDDMSGGDPVWRTIQDLPKSDEVMDEWLVGAHKDLIRWWRQSGSKLHTDT